MNKLKINRRGSSELVSSILLIFIAVSAMLLVTGTGQNIISSSHDAMGERIFVENVMFDPTKITIYVRNTGSISVNLEQVKINDYLFPLDQGVVNIPVPEGNRNSNPSVVTVSNNTIYPIYEEGSYSISFISPRNKDLGAVLVKYGYPPSIFGLTPANEAVLSEAPTLISAQVRDTSQNASNVYFDLYYMRDYKDTTEKPISLSLDGYDIESTAISAVVNGDILTISYQPTIIQFNTYYTIELRVKDSQGNMASKIWWFMLE